MNLLVTILMQIILRTNDCTIPDIQMSCSEYRIDKQVVQVCTGYYKGIDYEVVVDSDRILELWENDYPSFKRGQANAVWKNVYSRSIKGSGKIPEYCSIKILNQNRHD